MTSKRTRVCFDDFNICDTTKLGRFRSEQKIRSKIKFGVLLIVLFEQNALAYWCRQMVPLPQKASRKFGIASRLQCWCQTFSSDFRRQRLLLN